MRSTSSDRCHTHVLTMGQQEVVRGCRSLKLAQAYPSQAVLCAPCASALPIRVVNVVRSDLMQAP